MINSMSPDEAKIMSLFAVEEMLPVIDVRRFLKDEEDYSFVARAFSFIGREAGCTFVTLTPNYLDNLSRLGLLESPGALGLGAPTISGPNTYEPLEESFNSLKAAVESAGGRIQFGRSFVRITDLGRQFCQACVIEKASAGVRSKGMEEILEQPATIP